MLKKPTQQNTLTHDNFAPNYWWVNHKQTSRVERQGGYIWSPMTKKNGSHNQAYTNLTLVNPGDIVLSYASGHIGAIGVATGAYTQAPKPDAYGLPGEAWGDFGWRVPIDWTLLDEPLKPKDFLTDIVSLLPPKHSPINAQGNGNQGIYLAEISRALGELLLARAAEDSAVREELKQLRARAQEERALTEIKVATLPETEKQQLVRARRGQGLFRANVIALAPHCPLTGLTDERLLIASHIKPWRDCDNHERLDGANGLMLSPHIDRLFDQGLISFADNGDLLASEQGRRALTAWRVATHSNVGVFSAAQAGYLAYHRAHVFTG